MKKICLDTNVLIKLLINEEESNKSREFYLSLINLNYRIVAPEYLKTELYSVLLKKLHLQKLEYPIIKKALRIIENWDIVYIKDQDLLKDAFNLGQKLKLPAIYDCLFLALCMNNKISFVTADEKFSKITKEIYGSVYSLDEALKHFK